MEEKEQKEIRVWKEYRLHLVVLVVSFVSEVFIGTITLKLGSISLSFQPLVFGMVISLILYLIKPLKFIKEREANAAAGTMLIFVGPLLAKMGIASGESIMEILEVGPALLLQELGNLGTIFLALPIALLLGFKREAIGMTHSIGREQNLGLIIDRYGFNSAEARGVLIIYIVGTILGSVFIGPLASVLASIIPFDPRAWAMATGVGSAGMTAACLSSLIELFPNYEEEMTAYSGMSNLLTQCDGVYVSLFIGLPLCNWLYKVLEPRIGRKSKKDAAKSE